MSKSSAAVPVVDLADFDTRKACDNAVEIELVHPVTEAGIGVFISILGRESSVFQNALNSKINQSLKLQAVGRGKPTITTVEGNEQEASELLSKCTTAWRTKLDDVSRPVVFFKGEEIAFSTANAKQLYLENKWIRQQVDKAVGDLSLFFQA
jgi:hypothetical protein